MLQSACGDVAVSAPDAGGDDSEAPRIDADIDRFDGGDGEPDAGGGNPDGATGGSDGGSDISCEDGWVGPDCDECVIYVDGTGGGSDSSGTTWSSAVDTVSAGIDLATSRRVLDGLESCSVWVRGGTYVPGTERADSFVLEPGVHLYGGFAGGEADRHDRDWEANETILSGDLGSTNVSRVVIGATDAVLDGFTVTGGQASSNGAGMYNDSASPRVANVHFVGNTATRGAGMYNDGDSAPTLDHVTFSGNTADTGAGMFNRGTSAPALDHVTFSGNTATGSGGAMVNRDESAPSISNTIFVTNTAASAGAIFNTADSTTTLTNVIFIRNEAVDFSGGAIQASSNDFQATTTTTLTNATFFANKASSRGGAIRADTRAPMRIRNSILWGNDADEDSEIRTSPGNTRITHSIVQGGRPDGVEANDFVESFSQNPLFVEDDADNLRLLSGSPAIDKGNSQLSGLPDGDLDGAPRIVDGTGDGDAVIDLGAYEFQP